MLEVIAEIEALETYDQSGVLVERSKVVTILRNHASNTAPQQVGGDHIESIRSHLRGIIATFLVHIEQCGGGTYDSETVRTMIDTFATGIAALRPAPQVVAGGEWQPIETAPKDGSRILGYSPYSYEVSSVKWHLSQSGISGYWEGSAFTRTAPTHWMPQPATPAESPSHD